MVEGSEDIFEHYQVEGNVVDFRNDFCDDQTHGVNGDANGSQSDHATTSRYIFFLGNLSRINITDGAYTVQGKVYDDNGDWSKDDRNNESEHESSNTERTVEPFPD